MGNQIIQLNLVDLNLVTMPVTTIVDPNSSFVETTVTRPAVGARTAGPHRYTIMCPHNDEAVVNVGQAASHRINDTGITGRTKSHVHWHTTADPNKTMVALGGPTKEGWAGHDANNLGANAGFMVVTENHSWIEAKNQQYLLSRDKDVVVRTVNGKHAVLQADQGEIDLVAKHHIYATSDAVSISASPSTIPAANYNYTTDWTTDMSQTVASSWSKDILTIIGAVTTAHDLGRKAKKTYKKWKEGKLKKDEALASDAVKWTQDVIKWVKTAADFHKLFSAAKLSPGDTKISATNKVGILAGNEAGLFGTVGASVGSALWTSISAGVSASLKGTLFAGVSSMYTSIKGYRKVEVGSDYGKVKISADNGDVEISAEESGLAMGGKTSATLMSSDGGVYIGGAKQVHIGGGDGSGFGYLASKASARLGKLSQTSNMKTTKLDGSEQIKIEDGKAIELRMHDTIIKMQKTKTEHKSKTINVKADKVSISAGKILLD